MATNPPFHVEDTDEDFFDKLVDDDVGPAKYGHDDEDNDSDDVKAFANLGIISDEADDDDDDDAFELKVEEEEGDLKLDGGNAQEESSFGCDSMMDREVGSGITSDSSADKNNGIPNSEVKVVDWNAFNADSNVVDVEFESYSNFYGELGDQNGKACHEANIEVKPGNEILSDGLNALVDYKQYQEGQGCDASVGNNTNKQDPNSIEYWESLYPGWKYDYNTGQWYQVNDDNNNNNSTTITHGNSEVNTASGWIAVSDAKVEDSYMQQAAQSVVAGTLAESGTTESVPSWNQVSQGYNEYPKHMVFDSQYPDWYYDTISQEWRLLETYNPSVVQRLDNGHTSTSNFLDNDNSLYRDYDQSSNYESQGVSSQVVDENLNGSYVTNCQQSLGQANNYESHGVGSQTTTDDSWKGSYLINRQQSLGQDENYESHGVGSQTTTDDSWKGSYLINRQQSLGQDENYESRGVGSLATDDNWSGSYGMNRQQSSGQADNYESQGVGSQALDDNWNGSYDMNRQQGLDTHIANTTPKSEDSATYGGNHHFSHSFGSSISINKEQQNASTSFGSVPSYNKVNHGHGLDNGTLEVQRFAPSGNSVQHFNYLNTQFHEQANFSNDYGRSHQPFSYSQQSFQGEHQYSNASHVGRSSAGRPPHALVTFGFGGKLIVMKDSNLSSSTYESQSDVQGHVSLLNLMDVVSRSMDSSGIGNSAGDYFRALCQHSFPGPLVGGSVGSKELHKWIDERIAHCGSSDTDYKKGERLSILLSLLKVACQHYGKLRSPFGTDNILKENDTPESAVAKLFASAKMSGKEFTHYGALNHCLQNLPSEAQMRATASEVQNLLVSGKKKEALQSAQEGQLWGPALVLASQLGEQFYVDTVKQMALRQLVGGSPLRTLCLLIAGQPAEVFSSGSSNSGDASTFNMSQQPAQFGCDGMLEDWEENLAVITANRTKDDELVIIHLGDCLWKNKSEITAAHICYLVAEANFESYSDSARLCLIGADHWKFPRTYASPEAIQRTELYEYSKALGNSQFILLPLQPYKLIYAYMLAEVGKVADSLKYCQAVQKSLKTGRTPEVDTWKQLLSSLEERIKTHQQGGYAANLAPTKLVGKLLNFFDSTAHRVVGGGLPPPAPSSSQAIFHGNVQNYQPMAHRVSNSQSTMAMSSLVPSASVEPINEWSSDNKRMIKHNRSVSEPDFGRSPQQETSPDASVSEATSRFSRFSFGSQLLQKMGLVLRPRSGKQAKLGEKNKFYYDEKLKRWVEEGVDPPAEDTALPPPPTTHAFHNGLTEYNLKSALNSEGSPKEGRDLQTLSPELTPGIPPIPPSTNQFSARGRTGVRSRYVDTFNQGNRSSPNLYQSPSVTFGNPAVVTNAKFFIPAPAPSSNEHTMEAIAEKNHQDNLAHENSSTSCSNDWSYLSPKPASPLARHRFPNMDNLSNQGAVMNGSYSHSPHSRRTASWGGSVGESFSPTKMGEIRSLGEALGMPPSTYMSDEIPSMHPPMKSGSFGDLHEVEF